MFESVSRFLRQIVPPVIATLIAALLIAGFNRAFTTHLTQPRMAGLNTEASAPPPSAQPAPAIAAQPAAPPVIELVEETVPERRWEKGSVVEAEKDQTSKLAEAAPAPPPTTPPATRTVARKAEARAAEPRAVEQRPAGPRLVEPRPAEPQVIAAPAPMPAPVTTPARGPVVIGAPVTQGPLVQAPVAQAPPPVIAAEPMVTVPDRPGRHPVEQAQTVQAPRAQEPPPNGPIGVIVNTLKPSSLFARAKEFGERIEAAGNEILPSIRN